MLEDASKRIILLCYTTKRILNILHYLKCYAETIMKLDKRTIIEMHGFLSTFELYPVTDEWRDELHNYFIQGLPPGSFHTALLANDLTDAVFRSHPMNQWKQIQEFIKWTFANAPAGSWGSYENVDIWLKMSAKERRVICENRGWLITEKELAWKLLEEM